MAAADRRRRARAELHAAPSSTSTATRSKPPASRTSPIRTANTRSSRRWTAPGARSSATTTRSSPSIVDTRVLQARAAHAAQELSRRLLPEQLAALTQNYELRKGGQERVAGYDAQALILKPRDEFRYGHKLWAEITSGLLLKARMLNEKPPGGRAVPFHPGHDQRAVTRDRSSPASLLPVAPLDPQPSPAAGRYRLDRAQPAGRLQEDHGDEAHQAGRQASRWRTWCTRTDWRRCRCSSSRCPQRAPTRASRTRGRSTIYTRSLPDQLVTVLGETPAVTVMQMANSVASRGR